MIGFLGTKRSRLRPKSWPFAMNRDSWQSEGLLAWWAMGYQGLAEEMDLAGNYDLANTGTTIESESGIVYTRTFVAAESDYLQMDRAPVTAVPLSMSALFKSDSTTLNQCLCVVGNSGSAVNRNQFLLYLNGAGASDLVVARTAAGAALSEASTSVGYTAGVLQHAGAVFAAANDRRVYLNGGSKGTNGTSRTPSGVNRTTVGGINQSTSDLFMSGHIADVRIYGYALTDQQMSELADPQTRWDLYYPIGRKTWSFPSHTAGASGAISGTNSFGFTNTGSLSGAGALAGTNAIVFTDTGTLMGAGALAGTNNIAFTDSGTLAGAGALAGQNSMAFTESGTLVGAGALAGSNAAVFTNSGDLEGAAAGEISGTNASAFSNSGTLTGAGALAGQNAMVFTESGVLVGAGALAGSNAMVLTCSGALIDAGALPAVPPVGDSARAYPRRTVARAQARSTSSRGVN